MLNAYLIGLIILLIAIRWVCLRMEVEVQPAHLVVIALYPLYPLVGLAIAIAFLRGYTTFIENGDGYEY